MNRLIHITIRMLLLAVVAFTTTNINAVPVRTSELNGTYGLSGDGDLDLIVDRPIDMNLISYKGNVTIELQANFSVRNLKASNITINGNYSTNGYKMTVYNRKFPFFTKFGITASGDQESGGRIIIRDTYLSFVGDSVKNVSMIKADGKDCSLLMENCRLETNYAFAERGAVDILLNAENYCSAVQCSIINTDMDVNSPGWVPTVSVENSNLLSLISLNAVRGSIGGLVCANGKVSLVGSRGDNLTVYGDPGVLAHDVDLCYTKFDMNSPRSYYPINHEASTSYNYGYYAVPLVGWLFGSALGFSHNDSNTEFMDTKGIQADIINIVMRGGSYNFAIPLPLVSKPNEPLSYSIVGDYDLYEYYRNNPYGPVHTRRLENGVLVDDIYRWFNDQYECPCLYKRNDDGSVTPVSYYTYHNTRFNISTLFDPNDKPVFDRDQYAPGDTVTFTKPSFVPEEDYGYITYEWWYYKLYDVGGYLQPTYSRVEGVTGDTYIVRPEDCGRQLVVSVVMEGVGTVSSSPCLLDKFENMNRPVKPELLHDAENQRFYILNAKSDQEYIFLPSEYTPEQITETMWGYSVSPAEDGSFDVSNKAWADVVNYVYTRYKETPRTYAGKLYEWSSEYFGGSAGPMKDFKMTVTGVNCSLEQGDNGSYTVPLNGILKIESSPLPVNATNASEFNGMYSVDLHAKDANAHEAGTFYEDEACTIPITRNYKTYYKTVYLKCTRPGSQYSLDVHSIQLSKYKSQTINVKDENGGIKVSYVGREPIVIERTTKTGWEKFFELTDIYPTNSDLTGLTTEWAEDAPESVRPQLDNNIEMVDGRYSIKFSDPGEEMSLGEWYIHFRQDGKVLRNGSLTSTVLVRVIPAQPYEINTSVSDVTLNPGDTLDLSQYVTVIPEDAEYTVTWGSDGNENISVDSTGVVTVADTDAALGESAVITITATGEYQEVTTTITVNVSGAKYPVWVKGIQVTSNNMLDVLGDNKVSFNPTLNTLTLNGVEETIPQGVGKESIFIFSELDDLEVKLVKSNTVTLEGNVTAFYGNNMSLAGGGKLFVNGGAGIFTNKGEIELKGHVNVTIDGGDYAIWSMPNLSTDAVVGIKMSSTGTLKMRDLARLSVRGNSYPIDIATLDLESGFEIVSPDNAEYVSSYAFNSAQTIGTFCYGSGGGVITDVPVVLENVGALRGDANDDGEVDVEDITHVNDFLLSRSYGVNNFLNADIDATEELDVVDVTGIANISLNASSSSAPGLSTRKSPRLKTDYVNFEDYLSAADMSMLAGERKTLEIELNSSIDYTAFQMDIALPDGVKISKAELGDRVGNSHVLAMRDNGDFTRLMSYSSKNRAIVAGTGSILRLELVAEDSFYSSGEIWIDNIRFVPTEGTKVFLPAFNVLLGTITGIDKVDVNPSGVSVSNGVLTINGSKGGVATITSMNGVTRSIKLESGANHVDLDHGVYIVTVNGQSVKVRL